MKANRRKQPVCKFEGGQGLVTQLRYSGGSCHLNVSQVLFYKQRSGTDQSWLDRRKFEENIFSFRFYIQAVFAGLSNGRFYFCTQHYCMKLSTDHLALRLLFGESLLQSLHTPLQCMLKHMDLFPGSHVWETIWTR